MFVLRKYVGFLGAFAFFYLLIVTRDFRRYFADFGLRFDLS